MLGCNKTAAGTAALSLTCSSLKVAALTVAGASGSSNVMTMVGKGVTFVAPAGGLIVNTCGGVRSGVLRLATNGRETLPAASNARTVSPNKAPVSGASAGTVKESVLVSSTELGSTLVSTTP